MTTNELIDFELEEPDEIAELEQQPPTDAQIEERYANSSFRVLYQSNNYFLPQIKDLIEGREIINLRPEYQRRLRWTTKQKSLLIESLLLNVPIPPIFLYESDLARYEVMDGQQRLSTVNEYLSNDFALAGLENLKFLTGKRYNQLPPRLKRGLDRASISAIVLLHETQAEDRDPSLVRRYVFQRLNTGGKALNPQEIRNSLYSGKFNDLIIQLTRLEQFCTAFGIPPYTETNENEYYEDPARKNNQIYRKMGDCQLVLRFFAFRDDAHIRGSVRSMLDGAMERHARPSDDDITALRQAFTHALATSVAVFGERVFTLPPDDKGIRRVSAALYDAVMVALDRRAGKAAEYIHHAAAIRDGIDRLSIDNPGLLTGRANTAQSIKDRIAAVTDVFDQVAP
ncbi:DUF262 domain-containing protein [Cupriavidus alkaliphilus]|uniref:DUF262 domain-containing protein n=1 Tax=Cupriavidus alkaliphilus TaxID=942866 RepID=UPI00339D30DC